MGSSRRSARFTPAAFHGGLTITPRPVVHTSHPACGYLIEAGGGRTAWAPEFLEFPSWAAGADLMFAEAAGWARPIRFAKDTGGHAPALEVAEQAARHGVRRLVFAHIGRPSPRWTPGSVPPFGEIGAEGAVYTAGCGAGGSQLTDPHGGRSGWCRVVTGTAVLPGSCGTTPGSARELRCRRI